MLIKASVKNVRVSPRKVRLVADAVRGLNLQEAFDKLALLNKRSVGPIVKLLESAKANAEHNYNLAATGLMIKEITVDDGATMFRWMPKAFGRATPLRKRTSYIKVTLEDKEGVTVKGSKKTSKAAKRVKKEDSVENVSSNKVQKPVEDGEKAEIFDPRMKGKHRNNQHQDGKQKKEKGVFKKMFQRKTGV